MRKQTHDPYRSASLNVPQLPAGLDGPRRDGPLNVLAYVDRYPPHVNAGAEWYLHHALRDLARRGHTVAVATQLPWTEQRWEMYEGVEVWPASVVDTLADHVDVLVGHLLWTKEVVTLAHDRGLPLVYVLHNDMQVAHWTLTPDNVTVIVANSAWVAGSLQIPAPCAVVRPVVLGEDYRIEADAFDREFVTLVNPNTSKGALTLYGLAHQHRARRFLAVEGGYGSQIRPRSRDENVTWLRPTPRMRDDVYARTRVLLVPSAYESWGRVAVEAMHAGCVVIAHPTAGLVEACGDAAVFVDRDDLAGWQDALVMLDDRAVFAEWSARSREQAVRLEIQSLRDLDTWENTIRVAAGARHVPSGA